MRRKIMHSLTDMKNWNKIENFKLKDNLSVNFSIEHGSSLKSSQGLEYHTSSFPLPETVF